MNNETHIVSMIIHARPEFMDDFLAKAGKLPKAECHTSIKGHKFILVFEAGSEIELSGFISEISTWKGVLSAQLCYHHCETSESLQEEINHETHAA